MNGVTWRMRTHTHKRQRRRGGTKQARRRGFLLGRWGKKRPSFGDNWRRGRQTKRRRGRTRGGGCAMLSRKRDPHTTRMILPFAGCDMGGAGLPGLWRVGVIEWDLFRCLCGICCGCTGPVTTLRRARFESRDACDVSVCCGCAHYENKKTRPCLSSAITHASQFDALQHPPLALRALSPSITASRTRDDWYPRCPRARRAPGRCVV